MNGIVPEIYMMIMISGLLLYGARKSTTSVLWQSVGILIMSGILSWNNKWGSGPMIYGSIYHDNMSAIGKGVVLIGGAICLIAIREGVVEKRMEYPIIVVMSGMGLGLMLSAYDLMGIYLAIEYQSLGLYVLATIQGKKESAYVTEAGVKYFVIGAVASGILLYGSTMIYGELGTTNIEAISRIGSISGNERVVIGKMMVMAGLLFKLSAAPFHMWAPDVYEGAPRGSTMIFAVVPKLAIIGVIVRINYVGFEEWGGDWMVWVGLISIVVGALGGLYQRRIKRFMAYSSIGHVGYIMLGLGSGELEGVMVYVLIYMLMSMSIWTAIVGGKIQYIDELRSWGRENKWLGGAVGIGVLAMAGIPPMAGFYAKMNVFMGVIEAGRYIEAIIGIVVSVVGAYYYLRWIKIMNFEKGEIEGGGGVRIGRGGGMIISGVTIILLLYGLEMEGMMLIGREMGRL